MEKHIIAIDFDGTIVEHKFPEIGKILDGARETINYLYELGHEIIIWTCRNETDTLYEFRAMEHFLQTNCIKYTAINKNSELSTYQPFPKIFAHVYIDDRNFGGFPGWKAIREYYKKVA